MNKLKLNIGSGEDYLDGYINLDINTNSNANIIRDLERGLPFDDNKFDEIYCSHVLEHIKSLFFVMNEFWRVLKPGGILIIKVPHGDSEMAYSDPTHIRRFCQYTFTHFTKSRFKAKWPAHPEIKCIFEILEIRDQHNEKDPIVEEIYVKMKCILKNNNNLF